MKGLNQVNLIGNLGGDPEMRFTPNGKPVTSFTMATSRKWKDDSGNLVENTQWHNIVCWNALAENVNKALNKGSAVFVSGSIEYRKWQGTDSQIHYKTEIIADDVIFLDKPAASPPAPAAAKSIDYKSAGQKMMADASAKATASKIAQKAVELGAIPVDGESQPSLPQVLRELDKAGLTF